MGVFPSKSQGKKCYCDINWRNFPMMWTFTKLLQVHLGQEVFHWYACIPKIFALSWSLHCQNVSVLVNKSPLIISQSNNACLFIVASKPNKNEQSLQFWILEIMTPMKSHTTQQWDNEHVSDKSAIIKRIRKFNHNWKILCVIWYNYWGKVRYENTYGPEWILVHLIKIFLKFSIYIVLINRLENIYFLPWIRIC